jgi:SAM-dependent methyltransferase
VEDVPVMLLDDVPQTIGIAEASLKRAKDKEGIDDRMPQLYLESLGISEEEKRGVIELARKGGGTIDPVVSYLIGATNGNMYRQLIGRLGSYPIPDLRLPPASGQGFLDLGCNWGRWCIAAARKGYRAVGIDPSLGAIMAARRVSESLNLDIKYVVADARYLPFAADEFENVFSYSVLQHVSKADVELALFEVGRVLKQRGVSLIQMPTLLGLRCLYHQARRRFKKPEGFEVRYWSIPALKSLFRNTIGKTNISVDCFFGIGLQFSDYHFMPLDLRPILVASEVLRRISRVVPLLEYFADSVYVKAYKSADQLASRKKIAEASATL